MSLGDAHVILGTVWLKSLGPTLWDISLKTMRFWKDEKEITLQGVFHTEIDIVESKLLIKILQMKGVAYMLKFIEGEENEEPEPHLKELEEVLREFSDVFEEPKGLPPSRGCDYRIPLINSQLSVTQFLSYRYPIHQKDEIKKQVRELRSSGII